MMAARTSVALGLVVPVAVMLMVPAGAQSTPSRPLPTPTPITVPLEQRNGSGMHGSVSVRPQGSKSAIQIQLQSPSPTTGAPILKSGSDCIAGRAAMSVSLAPISGGASRTIVAIPFSAFGSHHFVVDVRNATASAQASEACARI